jgi:predicted fused transcriptional regulator/phosphomethylpyrimidine kinase
MTPDEDKYYVLGNVVAGLTMLEESEAFASLIPEVRSNLAMALADAKGPDEVVGIPGRITSVQGKVRAAAHPVLGGSRNTARIILGAQRELPFLRAAIELKYAAESVVVMEGMGLEPQSLEDVFDQTLDPETRLVRAGRIYRRAYSEKHGICVPYTSGGHSREGAIIVLGETAVKVASKAIEIAEFCLKKR